MKDIIEGIGSGKLRSISRAISMVENRSDKKSYMIDSIFASTGNARIIGVTGAPGSGKSTLVDKLIKRFRSQNQTVAVLAVDPSSPYSGGAILGDRIRMQAHGSDDGVFIRSMASRGHLGGVAESTVDVIKILDAAGYDNIIIETIGVGQNEIDIVELADIVILILVPQMGDEIQILKAGVMEIGDIFVINKRELDGAERLQAEVRYNIGLSDDENAKIFLTSAKMDAGIDELFQGIAAFSKYLAESGEIEERRKKRFQGEIKNIIRERLFTMAERTILHHEKLAEWANQLYLKKSNIYELIDDNLGSYLKGICK